MENKQSLEDVRAERQAKYEELVAQAYEAQARFEKSNDPADRLEAQAKAREAQEYRNLKRAGGAVRKAKGGSVKKYAKGGSVSKRADGCAIRGKTKGRMV